VVIPDCLNFFSITFIINLQRHQKYYDKEIKVLEMVKNKLLDLNLQNFCAGVGNSTPHMNKSLFCHASVLIIVKKQIVESEEEGTRERDLFPP